MKKNGLVFHAKHAFMPNSLGYCGPDDRGRILQLIERGKENDGVREVLRGFEAAYPFLRLIARNSGREAFDFEVPEAYWIGNGLLELVPASEFYGFSHRELAGRDQKEVKEMFRLIGDRAPPHHTFHVLSTYLTKGVMDGPNFSNESRRRISDAIDSCRISWGEVREVGKRDLLVKVRPFALDDESIRLARPREKRILYNPEVRPFGTVKAGDVVSVHWNYACDVLSPRQVTSLEKFTKADLALANRLVSSRRR